MNHFFLLLFLVLLPVSPGHAQPAAEAYREPDTNLVFPSAIGSYRRVGVQTFSDAKRGMRIRYEGPGRADVFVYSGGYAQIPTGIDSDQLRTDSRHRSGTSL